MKKQSVVIPAGILLVILLFVLPGMNIALAQQSDYADLTKGLVAFYPFWGNANDESGNGHDGTLNGAVDTGEEHGLLGQAYLFTGQNNTLKFAGYELNDPRMTVCMRIKITEAETDTILLSTSNALKMMVRLLNKRYQVEIKYLGYKLILEDRNGIFEIDSLNPRWADFLVLTYDGSQIKFMIEDQVIDSVPVDKKYLPAFPAMVNRDIVYSFHGVLHEIRIYDRLLSERELRFIQTQTYRTIPFISTDSVTDIGNGAATIHSTISFNKEGKDIYRLGVCWDTIPNPFWNTSPHQFIDQLDSIHAVTHLINLAPNSTYYIRTCHLNSAGEGYSEELSFTAIGETVNLTLLDIDTNEYKIVKIGDQYWMAENLKTTRYNDGSPIRELSNNDAWHWFSEGTFCWYNYDVNYKNRFGAYYNIQAVNSNKLCPQGWHIPGDEDWSTLSYYLINNGYGSNGHKFFIAKSLASNFGWYGSYVSDKVDAPGFCQSTNNSTGFNGIPAGLHEWGGFEQPRSYCNWWSSDAPYFLKSISWESAYFKTYTFYGEQISANVRCIKDMDARSPFVFTDSIITIKDSSCLIHTIIKSGDDLPIYYWGVCWSENQHPDTTCFKRIQVNGSFYSKLTNLVPNTTYYLRAYAINSKGIHYGNELSFQTNNNGSVDINKGLTAFYPFNGNANDESGNHHNGVINGATLTFDRFGNSDKAYYFNGEGNSIIINDFNLNPMAMTITCWVKVMRNYGWQDIISKYSFWGDMEISLQAIENNYQSSCTIDGRWSSFQPLPFEINADTSSYDFLAVVYNGKKFDIYKNDILDTSYLISGKISNNNIPMVFGKYAGDCGDLEKYYFNGKLDDIRIYNRALNTAEIQALYNENTSIGSPGINDQNNNFGSLPTAITENRNEPIKIYPNPATNILYISNADKAFASVFDLHGRLLLKEQVSNGGYSLNVSGLARGIYVIKLIGSDRVFVSRFIKE
jgi:uncharacterized protein (TIGR02145 family)